MLYTNKGGRQGRRGSPCFGGRQWNTTPAPTHPIRHEPLDSMNSAWKAVLVVVSLSVVHLMSSLVPPNSSEDATSLPSPSLMNGRLSLLTQFNISTDATLHPYDMSVLIISYHKTGHDLQVDLANILNEAFPLTALRLTDQWGLKSRFRRRRHPESLACARLTLQAGKIHVQHAPDLYCSPEILAHILLDVREGSNDGSVLDRGTKVVHLVRNPYSMAVSNYHYHAQDPT